MVRQTKIKALTLIGLLLATQVGAKEITFPESFTIHQYNGVKVKSSFFSSTNQIELQGNKHELIVSYEDIFEDSYSDAHTVIGSEKFNVVFNYEGNDDLKVTTAELTNENAAFDFIQSPKLTITQENGGVVPHNSFWFTQVKTIQSEPSVETKHKNTPENVNNHHKTELESQSLKTTAPKQAKIMVKEPVKVAEQPVVTISPKVKLKVHDTNKDSNTKSQVTNEPSALDMLNFWWQRATEDERKKFIENIEQ